MEDSQGWRSAVSPFSNVLSADALAGLIARRREMEAIENAFARGIRHVALVGSAGTGKTSLARVFASQSSSRFPGGVYRGGASWAENPRHLWDRVLPERIVGPMLIVIDDVEAFDDAALAELRDLLNKTPDTRALLTSRLRISNWPDLHVIEVEGLSQLEFGQLVHLRNLIMHGPAPTGEVVHRLFELAKGNPAFALLAIDAFESRIVTSWDDLFNVVRDFETPGLFGPDGRPLNPTEPDSRKIILDVSSANDHVIEMLKRDPTLARELPPRRFEEIVGELLEKQGYEITLTPASRDGGFDIFAAKKDGLGTFLYIVECKRYVPPNHVGVEIVRSLYGVVQASRATAGAIVTTSFFTSGAEAFRRDIRHQMQLHDYIVLQRWIREFPSKRQ